MDALKQSDAEAAKHAVAPRVSLSDIETAIACRFHVTGRAAISAIGAEAVGMESVRVMSRGKASPLAYLSICILVMKNGFTVVGKSAPASPENFNEEFGKKLAYDDCIRQLWPLMGFALRDKLDAAKT